MWLLYRSGLFKGAMAERVFKTVTSSEKTLPRNHKYANPPDSKGRYLQILLPSDVGSR